MDGEEMDRDIDEIAVEFAEKAIAEWGKPEGELLYAKRAPAALYEKWKNAGVIPRNIDREIVELMHRTHMGVDQDYKNLMKQGTRVALGDGWGGSMLATDQQDILFGTPYPLQAESNIGIMKEDHVNVIVHGHEPVLSESQRAPTVSNWAASAARPMRCCSATACRRRAIFSSRNL